MASTQRPPRRRSARALDDDNDDAPPAKKAKMDDQANGVAAGTMKKKGGAAAKKGKGGFDEDDGFTFSRPKAKKTATADKTSTSTAAPVLEKPATDERPVVEPEKGRPKRNSLEAGAQDDKPRRRSARLSGEKSGEQVELSMQTNLLSRTAPSRKQQRAEREGSPGAPTAPELHVEKKRGKEKSVTPTAAEQSQVSKNDAEGDKSLQTTKIALPFQDTPVIVRNREMRQSSGSGMRRSSGQLRGRRASSLIESGTSNAMPHGEVRTEDFYKHIAPSILEPRRMKQLLMWCATRAMPDRPTGTSGDVNAILAARTIEEELLKDFANKAEMSDWFDRVESAPEVLVKKPNPRNIQNAAKLKELQAEKKRLETEKAAWTQLLSSFSQTQQDAGVSEQILNPHRPVDSNALEKPQSELLQASEGHSRMVDNARTRLTQATDSLEFKIDSFGDGVHKLEKFREVLDETVDQVQKQAGEALDSKEQTALQRAGTEKVGVHDLLRGLSRAAQR